MIDTNLASIKIIFSKIRSKCLLITSKLASCLQVEENEAIKTSMATLAELNSSSS